jgi:hypothetical protein
VCIVHGEPTAAQGLGNRLGTLGVPVTIAAPGTRVDLSNLPALAQAPDFQLG